MMGPDSFPFYACRIPVTVMKPVTHSIAPASGNGETQEAPMASAIGMSANPGSVYSISQPVEAGSEANYSGEQSIEH